ncbi:hypothetical protein BH09ACT8_BH09ACT8_43060 [soil metagenome]
MSVKVDLDQLADALAEYSFAYLVTVGDDYRAKTIAVSPVLNDGVFDVGPVGGGTRRNVAAHDNVTLLWPPREPDGYSLIVDGRALASSDDAPLQIAPTHAVLHRPATPNSPPSASGCGDDCLPVG